MRHQLHSISTEGIRLDDVDACLDVIHMNFADQVRVGHVQFVEASADKYAFAIQHRAHCAVADQNPILQFGQELFHRRKV